MCGFMDFFVNFLQSRRIYMDNSIMYNSITLVYYHNIIQLTLELVFVVKCFSVTKVQLMVYCQILLKT